MRQQTNQRGQWPLQHKGEANMKVHTLIAAVALAGLAGEPRVRADEVTDWNQNMLLAAHVAGTSPFVMSRAAAIVHASIFDAINGIERRYTPVHVTSKAPRGASRRDAVIQAAYVSLVNLYPAQKATLNAELTASLANVLENEDPDDPG